MDTKWIEYKCKSGQTLYYYNKVTGERKWPCSLIGDNQAMIGQPVINKDLCTQTDIGCPSSLGQSTETSSQQKPFVFHAEDVKDEEDSSIDGDGIIDAMLKVLEKKNDGNGTEATDNSVINKDSDENIKSALQEGNDVTRHLVEFTSENNSQATDCILQDSQEENGNDTDSLMEFTSDNRSEAGDVSVLVHGQKEKCAKWSPCKKRKNLFKCSYCNKKFSTNSHLIIHIRIHTGEKPFECSYCKKRFTQKCTLIFHLRKHSGEKPFECSYCKKKFSRKDNLCIHLRLHTRDKLFKCSYCKKEFAINNALRRHLRTHTQEKPFECSYCRKKFSQKANLIRHLPLHTGEKSFECSYCKKKFSQKGNLTRHLRVHNGEKPFECSYCKMNFSHKANLKRHFKRRHNGEKPFE